MIEIEKKFILTKNQKDNLIDEAEFLGEKKFTDIYYDNADFTLTKSDIWLRERDGKFELKIPLNESIKNRVSDQYRELDNERDILQYFRSGINKSLADFLNQSRYESFCSITTIRKKYKKNNFSIDLDSMDFGYQIAEIEYMTDDESKIQESTESIIAFAKKHHINTDAVVRGKVVEYIRLNNPRHFQILIEAQVIK